MRSFAYSRAFKMRPRCFSSCSGLVASSTRASSQHCLSSSTLPRFGGAAAELFSILTQRQCGRQGATTLEPALAPRLDPCALDVTAVLRQMFPVFTACPAATSYHLDSEQARLFQALEAMLQKSSHRSYGSALAETFDFRNRWAASFGSSLFCPALRSSVGLPGTFGTEDLPMEADSVKRKRKTKMNKHKHRKLRRRLRKSRK